MNSVLRTLPLIELVSLYYTTMIMQKLCNINQVIGMLNVFKSEETLLFITIFVQYYKTNR